MTTHHLSRRTMLRGIGVSMALPWMESLRVWGDEPKKNVKGREKSSQGRRRFGAQKKAQIMHRHLAVELAVSNLTEEYGAQPTITN